MRVRRRRLTGGVVHRHFPYSGHPDLPIGVGSRRPYVLSYLQTFAAQTLAFASGRAPVAHPCLSRVPTPPLHRASRHPAPVPGQLAGEWCGVRDRARDLTPREARCARSLDRWCGRGACGDDACGDGGRGDGERCVTAAVGTRRCGERPGLVADGDQGDAAIALPRLRDARGLRSDDGVLGRGRIDRRRSAARHRGSSGE